MVKLNTYTTCKDLKRTGYGGVIRNNKGEWTGGFDKNLGRCSAFVAELLRVFERLNFIYRVGLSRVELNVDSLAAVKGLEKGVSNSIDDHALLRQI